MSVFSRRLGRGSIYRRRVSRHRCADGFGRRGGQQRQGDHLSLSSRSANRIQIFVFGDSQDSMERYAMATQQDPKNGATWADSVTSPVLDRADGRKR